jgi:multiple sugar transport system permease protein
VAGDPRSLARRGQLHLAGCGIAAIGLAGIADLGDSNGGDDRHLAMGALSLPPSVYEAAQIDGASAFKTFWRITLPLLLPTIVMATILRSVDLLRFFDIIYITTQGGPGNASNTLNIYGFRVGFEFFNIGYASALMLTLTAIVFGVVLAFNRLRGAVAW